MHIIIITIRITKQFTWRVRHFCEAVTKAGNKAKLAAANRHAAVGMDRFTGDLVDEVHGRVDHGEEVFLGEGCSTVVEDDA